MRAVVQRVSKAAVEVNGEISGSIAHGSMILLGVAHDDTLEDADWLAQKISDLRIFHDEEGKMNRSCAEVGGDFLVISQFTLHARYKKGTRPSFVDAARPEIAIPLYERFMAQLSAASGKKVASGIFGAMMQVSLVNDGPVTLVLDTKAKD